MDLVLYVIALVLFALAAAGVSLGRFNPVAGGLFLWLLAAAF